MKHYLSNNRSIITVKIFNLEYSKFGLLMTLSRTQETLLNILESKKAKEGLTEDEDVVYSLLHDRYQIFLEEGMKKLRRDSSKSMKKQKGYFFSKKRKTEKPEEEDQIHSGTHWSWITPNLIIGALPLCGENTDYLGHISELKKEIEQENKRLKVVVCCIPEDESVPDPAMDWACKKVWKDHFHNIITISFPILQEQEITKTQTLSSMASLCQSITSFIPFSNNHHNNDISHSLGMSLSNISKSKYLKMSTDKVKVPDNCPNAATSGVLGSVDQENVVYIYCKTGASRSWAVLMCVLIFSENLSIEDAELFIKTSRSKVNPAPHHFEFIKKFAEYCEQSYTSENSKNEDSYIKFYQQVLKLPINLKLKLYNDLSKHF